MSGFCLRGTTRKSRNFPVGRYLYRRFVPGATDINPTPHILCEGRVNREAPEKERSRLWIGTMS